ncbi:MAG: Na+/H+ antiporter NhaA [Bacteroidales bacterium]|nr:Na+/H+ antiporter NhaA [Bacteroidales bacterium]
MDNSKQGAFERFIHHEATSSLLLLGVTVLALVIANSPLLGWYDSFLGTKLTLGIGSLMISKSLILWINDGLMAIFFFVIGLEIKREILIGELSSIKKASLPVFAAIGGMAFPIVIFMSLNERPQTASGWAIPMATDIAFTLGVLNLLGKRVPKGLKVFLTAFAIVDDLGAIIVIAVFYSPDISWDYILWASAILTVLFVMSGIKLYVKYLFFVAGVVVWFLFLKSGIHATIAGVLIALTIPMKRKMPPHKFHLEVSEALGVFTVESFKNSEKPVLNKRGRDAVDTIEQLTEKIQSPLQYLENKLHGWVAYLIMPIFAFANAGVYFAYSSFSSFSVLIATALVLGNFIGISLFSFIAVKLRFAGLPKLVKMKHVFSISILGGLGFTMSLFITNLSFFDVQLINEAKLGILLGSLIAGVVGFFCLKFTLDKELG